MLNSRSEHIVDLLLLRHCQRVAAEKHPLHFGIHPIRYKLTSNSRCGKHRGLIVFLGSLPITSSQKRALQIGIHKKLLQVSAVSQIQKRREFVMLLGAMSKHEVYSMHQRIANNVMSTCC